MRRSSLLKKSGPGGLEPAASGKSSRICWSLEANGCHEQRRNGAFQVAIVILVFKSGVEEAALQNALATLGGMGLDCQMLDCHDSVMLAVNSDTRCLPNHAFGQLPGVEKIIRIGNRFPLSESAAGAPLSFPDLNRQFFEPGVPVVIAGPCSVESQPQITRIALQVKQAGAHMLRGGAFKPRTSPYDFAGLGREALEYLRNARVESGLPIVSEVMSAEQVHLAEPFVDVFQIGTRNMYNYELLKEVGKTRKPVLLKRAMSATLDEFLQAAEYIIMSGNSQVVLCERGIRTFETRTRNTLDLGAVAVLKTLTNLPVIVDPSHGTGRRELVEPMSRAAIACGADGLIVEVHDDPSNSISDSGQAITPEILARIITDTSAISSVLLSATQAQPAGLHSRLSDNRTPVG